MQLPASGFPALTWQAVGLQSWISTVSDFQAVAAAAVFSSGCFGAKFEKPLVLVFIGVYTYHI